MGNDLPAANENVVNEIIVNKFDARHTRHRAGVFETVVGAQDLRSISAINQAPCVVLWPFVAFDIPDFMVQAVVRAEPALRGCALVLISGKPPLWNVVAANTVALRAGIHLGMTKSQAEQFCGIEIRQRSRSARESRACGFARFGLVRFSARGRYGAGYHRRRSCRACFFIRLGRRDRAAIGAARVPLGPGSACGGCLQHRRGDSCGARFPGNYRHSRGRGRRAWALCRLDVLFADAEVLETLERWGVATCEALAACRAAAFRTARAGRSSAA